MRSPSSSTLTDAKSHPEPFPELLEFQAEQQARHRRIVAAVAGASGVLLIIGVFMVRHGLVAERIEIFSFGCIIVGLALVGLGRAAISAWTDIDTRDRRAFDPEPSADVKLDDTEGER
jgi:hypothetical protein